MKKQKRNGPKRKNKGPKKKLKPFNSFIDISFKQLIKEKIKVNTIPNSCDDCGNRTKNLYKVDNPRIINYDEQTERPLQVCIKCFKPYRQLKVI